MRRLLPLLFGLYLLGAGEGAFATVYKWTNASYKFVTERPVCSDIANQWMSFENAVNGGSGKWWWNGDCTGAVHGVGSTVTFGGCLYNAGLDCSYSWTATLSGVIEDDVTDDLTGISIQRVLLLVGCSLMAGLGWIMAAR